MIVYIYTLTDPISNQIRYVGKSNDPYVRYRKHINETKSNKVNNHRVNWIKHLLKNDLKPILDIIDEVPITEWIFWEQYWICQVRAWGFNLVNGTDGGENPPSWKGRTHSSEYKQLRRKIMKTNNPSKHMNDKWKENISLAHKNNKFIPTNAIESNKKKVCQYTLDGKLIKIFNSITEAAKLIGLANSSPISAVCNNKRKKAGGYKWSFLK